MACQPGASEPRPWPVYVLRAGPDYELLGTNTMDEVTMATPAVSDGLLVVSTLGHVVGTAEPPQTAGN